MQTMKIKLRTRYASEAGTFQAGDVATLTREEAVELLTAGKAEEVGEREYAAEAHCLQGPRGRTSRPTTDEAARLAANVDRPLSH
jgi:hypothetical protein